MATLLSLERYLPPHRYDQSVVTGWVREWLGAAGEADVAHATRLLSVYASAGVKTRASVVPGQARRRADRLLTRSALERDVVVGGLELLAAALGRRFGGRGAPARA